jgi:hypothetical protein
MKPATINLHIDRIVLDGVGQMDPGQLSLVIRKELHRLISDRGLHSSLNQPLSIKQIAAEPISLTESIRERSLGNKIAGSVYCGMKP